MKNNAFESVKLSLNTRLKTRSSRDEGDQVREILQVRAQFYRSFYAILRKPVERFSINETDDEFSMEEKSLFENYIAKRYRLLIGTPLSFTPVSRPVLVPRNGRCSHKS